MAITLHPGDSLGVIPRLVAEGVVCDAVVTDPPYHLSATVQRFGGPKGAGHGNEFSDLGTMSRVNESGGAGATARLARGFMGCQWDGGDIAFRPETWATIATILRPGGFLLAFGGTRTYHRLACAIEDAGFVIQDTIAWLYGSGFPKRRDMLKPAMELICLAYKPGGKRTMQVDECRVGTDSTKRPFGAQEGSRQNGYGFVGASEGGSESGRWPANVCHDGSEEVTEAFPDAPGQLMRVGPDHGRKPSVNVYGDFGARPDTPPRGDTGSAARFFYSSKAGELDRWTTTRQELTLSWSSESGPCQAVLLVATALSPPRVIAASESITDDEWNTFLFGSGLTDLCQRASKSTIRMTTSSTTNLKTWSWLTRLLTSDFTPVVTSSMVNGSNHADDAANTSLSISFTLSETALLPSANRVLSGGKFELNGREKRVSHPTVKPISLMEWLVKLVCPENGLVLDPFAGTGTTGIAAIRARRNAILIEKELSYIADIRERLAFYEGGGTHSAQAKNRNRQSADHGPLFAEPFNDALDCTLSYDAAIQAIGERVKAGEPLPTTGYFGNKP